MDAVVIVDPAQYQRRRDERSDVYAAALNAFRPGRRGPGHVPGVPALLSFAEAAHVWMYSHLWSKKRPELAAELLPVILAASADSPSNGASDNDRYERSSVIRSIVSNLPPEQRLEFLRNPVHGRLLQRAFLDDKTHDPLTDEELVACVPEITRPQEHVSAGSTPDVIRYIQRFPRLVVSRSPGWSRQWRTSTSAAGHLPSAHGLTSGMSS
jgi:hypothetical protein